VKEVSTLLLTGVAGSGTEGCPRATGAAYVAPEVLGVSGLRVRPSWGAGEARAGICVLGGTSPGNWLVEVRKALFTVL